MSNIKPEMVASLHLFSSCALCFLAAGLPLSEFDIVLSFFSNFLYCSAALPQVVDRIMSDEDGDRMRYDLLAENLLDPSDDDDAPQQAGEAFRGLVFHVPLDDVLFVRHFILNCSESTSSGTTTNSSSIETLLSSSSTTDEQLGCLLCRCCFEIGHNESRRNVAATIVNEILKIRQGVATSFHSDCGQNVLHICAYSGTSVDSTTQEKEQQSTQILSVVRNVLAINPSLLQSIDWQQFRPLDCISQSIIMLGEAQKYYRTGRLEQFLKDQLALSWEIVGQFLQGQERDTLVGLESTSNLMLHTVLRVGSRQEIPMSLINAALVHFRPMLSIKDGRGNLPLHYAAMTPPSGDDILEFVLSLHESAAKVRNHQGHSPLSLAIQSGRTLETGCRSLLLAAPETMPMIDPCYLEAVLWKLEEKQDSTLVYILIQQHACSFFR